MTPRPIAVIKGKTENTYQVMNLIHDQRSQEFDQQKENQVLNLSQEKWSPLASQGCGFGFPIYDEMYIQNPTQGVNIICTELHNFMTV